MNTQSIVLDLEMNPVDYRISPKGLHRETIEFGAVRIGPELRIRDTYACVVRPAYNRRIEPGIVRLTGITTREVRLGCDFSTALADFLRWIGPEPARIYSWSDCDLRQLREECAAKGLEFPREFENWTDFQAEYPRYLGFGQGRCYSLSDAVEAIGRHMDSSRAHRALYDAQETAELVLFALTREYQQFSCHVAQPEMRCTLGEACGGKLAALLEKMKKQEEMDANGSRNRVAVEYCR